MNKGLIHIYCGDGKGKTTAALGLVLRASGDDYRVIVVQFLKGWKTSELNALKKMSNVTVIQGNLPAGFTWDLTDEQKAQMKLEHDRIFKEAVLLCGDGRKTLLILDEIIGALGYNYISSEIVLPFLEQKPAQLEVVLTGRNPDQHLLELADYVSEIKKIKHPMDKGINARKGIEF
jgi:cob(I)alamin adenosyltransferase